MCDSGVITQLIITHEPKSYRVCFTKSILENLCLIPAQMDGVC